VHIALRDRQITMSSELLDRPSRRASHHQGARVKVTPESVLATGELQQRGGNARAPAEIRAEPGVSGRERTRHFVPCRHCSPTSVDAVKAGHLTGGLQNH
jgi:hypothetical protein